MRSQTIAAIVAESARGGEFIVCEGVMGLFDGAAGGKGSTADLAALTGWPVVLVADVRGQGASAAAVVSGFAGHRADVRISGVIFNRTASGPHESAIAAAMARACPGIAVLGFLPRDPDLVLPERHLGLMQAREISGLEAFLEHAADAIDSHVDVAALRSLAQIGHLPAGSNSPPMPLPPLGRRIAVARDDAFAFCYPAVLTGWRSTGAEISFFSPLAGDIPDASCDAIYLPGGYPELHAGRIAASPTLAALRQAASRGAAIFGECGGYMVLGRGLEDAEGRRHAMAGLLPLETTFAKRKLHLGYREAALAQDSPLGEKGARFRGHEFHYATVLGEGPGETLFRSRDAAGAELGPAGLRAGTVAGSFVHLLDRA